MAFLRTSTSASLASKAWSTTELAEGISHILTDGRMELPDSAAQLEDPLARVNRRCCKQDSFVKVASCGRASKELRIRRRREHRA